MKKKVAEPKADRYSLVSVPAFGYDAAVAVTPDNPVTIGEKYI